MHHDIVSFELTSLGVYEMGSCLSGTLSRMMVESFVDQLQEQGFNQLQDKTFGLGKWFSSSTFGSDGLRNQAFKLIVDLLVPKFKKGIAMAGVSPAEMTGYMESYVNVYLAHHVMKCLLAQHEQRPEIQVVGLEEDMFKSPKLPNYPQEMIAAFQERWTTTTAGKISLTSKDKAEKELLSATLANQVTQIVSTIDVANIVSLSLRAYLEQKNMAERKKHGLFAAAGAVALQAGRQDYTQEQQDRDVEAQLKDDLGVIPVPNGNFS